MEILIIPNDFIINAVFGVNQLFQSDFLLRAVKIKNNAFVPIKLERIAFDLKSSRRTIKRISYSDEGKN